MGEIGLIIVGVYTVGYALFVGYTRWRDRRRPDGLRLPDKIAYWDAFASERVCDHEVTHERLPAPEHGRFAWRNRTTIHGVLPRWVSFSWAVDSTRALDEPHAVWADLLLGSNVELAEGGAVFAEHGDLVHTTRASTRSPRSAPIVDAARDYLEREPDLAAELSTYVEEGRAAWVAFRILARECPDRSVADRLAARFRDTPDPRLAAVIADYAYPQGSDRLVTLTQHPDERARDLALRALVRHRDRDGLARVDPASVPEAMAARFLECLGRRVEAERAALCFLERQDTTFDEALRTLAAVGGTNAIHPMLELAARRRDDANLQATIAVVRDRIVGRQVGEAGTLALTDVAESGTLSVTSTGQLSEPED